MRHVDAKRQRGRISRRVGNAHNEERAEWIRIEYLDQSMNSIAWERVKTENISRFGVRLIGTKAPPEFNFINLECERLSFRTSAALRNKYMGRDGFERLCLQLVDTEWPARPGM